MQDGYGFPAALLGKHFVGIMSGALAMSVRNGLPSRNIRELVLSACGLRCPKYDSAPRAFEGQWRGWPKVYSRLVLRAVNANWNDDGWNVNANPVTNPNEWNDENQIFFRNCRMPYLPLFRGRFA